MLDFMLGGDWMNSTNVSILNLLFQGNFTSKDLSMYLDIDSKTLGKNINQLNIILKDLNLNEIVLKNEKYYLNLNFENWRYLLNSQQFMSSEEIIDYLYVKFIFNGFINLEAERNQFGLSRSSINRYFLGIKNILVENGSIYKYENGKGLRLIQLSQEDKNIFCKKLIKIFVKSDFILCSTSIYFQLFKELKLENLLEQLYELYVFTEISATKFILAFSFSLKVCVERVGGFDFYNTFNEIERHKEVKVYIENNFKEHSLEYREQLFSFLLNLKNNRAFFEEETIKKGHALVNELKKYLNIDHIEKGFQELLMKKVYISLFKYENSILKVYSSKLNNYDKRLLKAIDNSLDKVKLKLYFYDKVVILNVLKKIIIESNKHHMKKILFLFNEVILPNDFYLKENLKKQIPHVNIDIFPTFYYQFNKIKCVEEYDLILSDEYHQDESVIDILAFNYLKVLEKIHEKVMERALVNIS